MIDGGGSARRVYKSSILNLQPKRQEETLKFQDTVTIQAPLEATWAFLTDANQVAQCAPGVESVEEVEALKSYKVLAAVGFGNMKVKFDSVLEFVELKHPSFAKIKAHGKAPGSAVDVIASMHLSEKGANETELAWEAEINVLGTIAALASRMMGSVTQKMTAQFFDCVKASLEG